MCTYFGCGLRPSNSLIPVETRNSLRPSMYVYVPGCFMITVKSTPTYAYVPAMQSVPSL